MYDVFSIPPSQNSLKSVGMGLNEIAPVIIPAEKMARIEARSTRVVFFRFMCEKIEPGGLINGLWSEKMYFWT